VAYFGATGDAAKQAITSEFEILRADLARICTDKAASIPGVEVVYGEYVASLSQPDDGSGPVRVDFVNGRPSEDFDLVVGADGLMGRARALSSGRPAKADVVHMGGVYLAYLTIPRTAADSPTRSRLYNAPGGRSIMLRPSRLGTGVVLQIRRPGDAELDAAVASQDMATQKALVSRLFADAGWEAKRVLEGIAASDDFYLQAQAQVRAPTWSKGRVVLIGDAAYCSTRGMGTTLAMYGAYTLAGELTKAIRSGGTVPDALAAYERELRPYVQGIQKTPPGIRAIQLPHSRTGVWLLNSFLQFITWSGVLNLFNFEGKGEDQVKQYEWAT
jgi:2-polyprenyl-6-methoxyphenol hydroxylase-like FAD-dependent oxidoreductase